MEKHMLHGKIEINMNRASSSVVEGLSKHDVCKIGDSMKAHGLMNYQIKPIAPGMKIAGTAVTVLTRPGDALYVQKVIEVLQPGDVVVIDAGDMRDVACIGERLSYFMQQKGAVGVVVDGAIRDSRGIIDMAFPTFSKSVCTKIFGSTGPGAINVSIQCGGVNVNPGDIIIGDDDGVVCIPREAAEEVLKTADEHLQGELDRMKRIENGESVTEVFGLAVKLRQWE